MTMGEMNPIRFMFSFLSLSAGVTAIDRRFARSSNRAPTVNGGEIPSLTPKNGPVQKDCLKRSEKLGTRSIRSTSVRL
jgi:hypothetical protein